MLTHQQEAFAQAVASGKSQAEAYRTAYPKSLRWKPDSVWNKASALMADVRVSARVDAIRTEINELGLWSRERSVRALVAVIDSAEKGGEVVAAVKELNAMHGFNAPQKIEHSGEINSIVRKVVDSAK